LNIVRINNASSILSTSRAYVLKYASYRMIRNTVEAGCCWDHTPLYQGTPMVLFIRINYNYSSVSAILIMKLVA